MKIIKTKRTILSLLNDSDFEELINMFASKDIFKYIKPHKNKTEQEHFEFLNLKLKQIAKETGYYWVIRDKNNNQFIGALNLTPISDTDRIQIGWMIIPEYRQKGIVFEVAQSVLDFAINKTKFNPIFGVFEEAKLSSSKILSKLGFSFHSSFIEKDKKIIEFILNDNSQQ